MSEDRRRKLVAALLTVLGMLAIWALGFHVRTYGFGASFMELDQPFWMESAQRYRYVERVAHGQGIPNPDTRMWAPEGYDPRSDTIVQEWLYGTAYRLLPLGDDVPVSAFVRILTRVIYCTGIFALVALCGVLTRNRSSALLACLAYAVILPAVERSTGQVLYREHLAIPVLVFHLYFLAVALQRDRRHAAPTAAGLLLAAMLVWKVMTFYYLFLAGFFGLWLVLDGRARRIRLALIWCLATPWLASLVLPVHLRFDRFALQAAGVAGATVVVVAVVHAVRPLPVWARAVGLAGLAGGALLALPEGRSYGHAWETIGARLQHLGRKPADPSELAFHARHFWSGNYRSPTPQRLLRDFGVPLLAAAPGLVYASRRLWRGRERTFDAYTLVAYLVMTLGASYLVFRKLQAFPAMLLCVLIGAGWLLGRGRQRLAVRAGILLCVAWMVALAYGKVPGPDRLWPAPPPAGEVSASQVHTGTDLVALTDWLVANTGPDDVVLADFAISPYLLVEADRPIALNCFFESPMVERYREYTEALVAEEADLHALCRRLQVRWVVHSAHQALRVDDEMSYRYTAAALDWRPASPLARFQYDPGALAHFALAWESAFFRVFEVLPDGVAPPAPRPTHHVLFSRALASTLFGEPAGSPWPVHGDPVEQLGAQVAAMADLSLASTALSYGDATLAEQLTHGALRRSPYEPSAYDLLARLASDPEVAQHRRDQAETLRLALAGEVPLPFDPPSADSGEGTVEP